MIHASRLSGTVLAVCFFLTASITQLSAQQNSAGTTRNTTDAKEIVTEGIGSGETRQDALHDAMRKAIEKAVGMYVMTKTVTVNNALLKNQILVASDAVVTNYTELDCVEHDGMWMIRIKAKVLPNEYLKYCPKQIADGVSATEIGNILNKRNAAKNAEKMFQEIAEDYLSEIIKFNKESVTISPNGDIDDDAIPLSILFSGKVDQDQFDKCQSRISAVLDKLSLQKTKIELRKDGNGRFAGVPEDLGETLWKKARLTKNDKGDYGFVAFRNYKKDRMIYTLYLVPNSIKKAVDRAAEPDVGYHYLVLSISYANKTKTDRVFFSMNKIGLAYYDQAFRMMGFPVYGSYLSPLTLSNDFVFQASRYPTFKITKKATGTVAGTLELSLPAESVRNMKSVYLYPLIWDSDLSTYWTTENREEAKQECDRIESKYWNSNR